MGLRSGALVIAIAGAYACAAVTGLSDYTVGADGDAGSVSSSGPSGTSGNASTSGTTTSSGSSGDASSSGATVDHAAIYVKASCALQKRCEAKRFAATYASDSECEADVQTGLESWTTPSEYDACTAKLMGADCTQREADFRECDFNGPTPDGAPCSRSAQCMTGRCKRDTDPNCGFCVPRPGEGQNCTIVNDCAPGFYCQGANKPCLKRVAEGGACTTSYFQVCATGLYCVNGKCVKDGALGEACTAMPCGAGLACVNSKCVEIDYAQTGAACGVQGNAAYSCVRGLCYSSKCVAEVGAGADCATDGTKPFCDSSIGACTNGKCSDRRSIMCSDAGTPL